MGRRIRDTDPGRLLTRRAFLVGGAQAGLFGLLFWRLYDLQITQGARYRDMAEENRISTRLVLPIRGIIADRSGIVLARSEKNFHAALVPEQTPHVTDTLKRLYDLLEFDSSERRRIARDLRRGRYRLPVLVRDNLDWETLSLLELHQPELPGVAIAAGEVRSYPFREVTAHVLGYVGPPTGAEAGDSPLLNEPAFRIGKTGVEKYYEKLLQGRPGSVQLEVNAYGQQVRELAHTPAVAGQELKLCLDSGLQSFAQERLAQEKSASAVVMDAATGGVYAMASHPSFDSNLFSRRIPKERWAKLNSDPLTPLLNKTLTGAYAPGSTFKMVVALAALVDGMSPDFSAFCSGHLDLGNHRFHCWKRGGHGACDMHRGIVESCDVYFYHLGQKLGVDKIAETARRLGLGAHLGVDLPHEKPGLIPTRAWKKKNFRESWQPGETLVAAIGQGYMLATPLQLATMTARLVGGGFAVKPHLALAEGDENSFPSLGLRAEDLEFLRNAMAGVVYPGGTAARARIGVEGYEMGGKTGTSQVRRITRAERAKGVIANEDLRWEERDHALFVGFAPVHAPRYVTAVVVEHGGGGSKTAAPLARDLLIEVQKRDPAGALAKPLVMPEKRPEPALPPEEDEGAAFEGEEE